MKCMIVHPDEVDYWRALVGKFPGEEVKIVEGTARADFYCDSGVPAQRIAKGDRCFAVSVSTRDRPYFSWESSYLHLV